MILISFNFRAVVGARRSERREGNRQTDGLGFEGWIGVSQADQWWLEEAEAPAGACPGCALETPEGGLEEQTAEGQG